MDDMMLERYTKRVGRLFRNYGPSVADVYGQANFSVMDMYSKYAKLDGGMAPQAYVTQPLWVRSNVFYCVVSRLVHSLGIEIRHMVRMRKMLGNAQTP